MDSNCKAKATISPYDQKNNYKYFYLLAMVFLSIMLCDSILVYKVVKMPFGYTSACAYIFPFWFVLADIITEVYGVKLSRKILWAAAICEILFSLVSYLLVQLPSPSFWKFQTDFNLIIGNLPKIVFSSLAAIIVSGYLNIYFVSTWKVLMHGKHFWLRSIGASWIGELFYTVISISFMMYGVLPLKGLIITVFWSYLIKAICTIFLAIPANIMAYILKNKEGVNECFDININPFQKQLHKDNILFIGGGNMAHAIIKGLITEEYNPSCIYVVDHNKDKLDFLSLTYKVNVSEQIDDFLPYAKIIVIAIKPQGAKELCIRLTESFKNYNPLVISLMAGITTENLNNWLGNEVSIIRAMPNTPASIQLGAIGLFANPKASITEKKRTELIFNTIGITAWFNKEEELNIITAVSGSGPAYYFYFIEVIRDITIKLGINPEIAQKFAIQTAYGACKLAFESKEAPSVLRMQVTSKNGTTAAALTIMQEQNLLLLIETAIHAAIERAVELSKSHL